MSSSWFEDLIQLNDGVEKDLELEEVKSVLEKSGDVTEISHGNAFRSVFHQLVSFSPRR